MKKLFKKKEKFLENFIESLFIDFCLFRFILPENGYCVSRNVAEK